MHLSGSRPYVALYKQGGVVIALHLAEIAWHDRAYRAIHGGGVIDVDHLLLAGSLQRPPLVVGGRSGKVSRKIEGVKTIVEMRDLIQFLAERSVRIASVCKCSESSQVDLFPGDYRSPCYEEAGFGGCVEFRSRIG